MRRETASRPDTRDPATTVTFLCDYNRDNEYD